MYDYLNTAIFNLTDMKDFPIEISLVDHSLNWTSGVIKLNNECAGNKCSPCNGIVKWFDPCVGSRFSEIFYHIRRRYVP